MEDVREEKLREEAWENSFQTYAVAYIMSERARMLEYLRRMLTFITFLSPIIVGAVALGYGQHDKTLEYALIAFIPLAIIQVVLGLWAQIARWDDKYGYYIESSIANTTLSDEFKSCAKIPANDNDKLERQISILNAKYGERGNQDKKYHFSTKERNRGMRYALIKFQRICAGCKVKPTSMVKTECKICGNI